MEQWRWIKGYEGKYQISNKGRVKSYVRNSDGKLLKLNDSGSYLAFTAVDKGIPKIMRVHVAVAKTFIGDVPRGYHVHHKDENKHNNTVENLEIMHPSKHAHLTHLSHPECARALSDNQKYNQRHIKQYTKDGHFVAEFANASIAESMTGVCKRNIIQVAHGDKYRNHAGGYVWKFADEVAI